MQRQPTRVRPTDKMQHNRPQAVEMNEMYEEVGGRANPNRYQGVEQTVSDTSTTVKNAEPKRKKAKSIFLVIAAAVLLSLLTLSLVAVVVYSPLARSSSQDNVASLQMKIQQLERQVEKLQVIEGTNITVEQLIVLQQSQQNRIDQLMNFETSATSQLISVQSLLQTTSQVQTNTVDELSTLRTVNLYENCIEETRTCTIPQSSSTYYWRSCSTSGLLINRSGYYTTGMKCEYESNYNYLDSTVLRKYNTNYVQCRYDVTLPSSTSSSHSSLPASFTATCTLIVTRCPLQQNILN